MDILEEIKKTVKDVYETDNESFVNALSYTLFSEIFVGNSPLEEILPIASEHETEEGVEENGWFLFDSLLPLLEENSRNAQRMYEAFMYSLDDFELYIKLIGCAEFLTREQYASAYNKGYDIFDKDLLGVYGITEKI